MRRNSTAQITATTAAMTARLQPTTPRMASTAPTTVDQPGRAAHLHEPVGALLALPARGP